jgi:hypothetical protein
MSHRQPQILALLIGSYRDNSGSFPLSPGNPWTPLAIGVRGTATRVGCRGHPAANTSCLSGLSSVPRKFPGFSQIIDMSQLFGAALGCPPLFPLSGCGATGTGAFCLATASLTDADWRGVLDSSSISSRICVASACLRVCLSIPSPKLIASPDPQYG